MKNKLFGKDVYAFLLKWPTEDTLTLGAPIPGLTTVVSLLGYKGTLDYKKTGDQGIVITLPVISFTRMPCQWAWTFKLTSITN